MTLPTRQAPVVLEKDTAALLHALRDSTPAEILEFCDGLDQIGTAGIAAFATGIRSYAMTRAAA